MHLSRAFFVFAFVWIAAMGWRLYPHFGDALRIEGRVTTLGDYLAETCGEKIGPAAERCLAAAQATGRRLVAREQGRSILLIEAPLLGWLFYLPLHRAAARLRRGGDEPPAMRHNVAVE